MGWITATVEVEARGCPAPEHLESGQELECLRPADPGPVTGRFQNPPGSEWDIIVETVDGCYARAHDTQCRSCPIAGLPEEVLVLRACVSDGRIRAHLVSPTKDPLFDVARQYAGTGILRAIRWGQAEGPTRRRIVDMDTLTPRQWEALKAALELGYFVEGSGTGVDEIARTLGIGRSAAHRHLRKGIERLLLELM